MDSIERVMVVDGGARGQMLGKKLADEGVEVFMSPGNPGNEDFAYSTDAEPTDINGQLVAGLKYDIDFIVVGSDDALGRGIVNEVRASNAYDGTKYGIFGPTTDQAEIETDREFAKSIAQKHGVPTGPYAHFEKSSEAMEYAESRSWPLYVKDNGLAQGKGAKQCEDIKEFEAAVKGLKSFVVEDFVDGSEASHHAFCDGETQLSIPFLVRDHKSLGENGRGPMTGGMGVVGPLQQYDAYEVEQLGETFVEPVVRELGFKGMLFSGLKGPKGYEKNLEWNARWGDPEAQVFLSLLNSDLLPVLVACAEGKLAELPKAVWDMDKSAVSLVLAAQGYPGSPKKGAIIEGIDAASQIQGVDILHAGTSEVGGKLRTAGGRVLNAVVVDENLESALRKAYAAAEVITFDGQPPIIRRDVGQTALSGQ